METTTLLLGIHCHQPVDNFGWAVLEAIEKSYLPFFETVEPFERFRFSVHFSGWLLEEIRRHTPALFASMQRLAKKGRIEFLSGGYYEPVLASIPSRDRRDQIMMLNRYIEEHFGQRPRGVWLTERVWEDAIINDLHACGIAYTLVDDYHFLRSGFSRKECDGYYFTENGGDRIGVFPISKPLRYALPFAPVSKAVEAVRQTKTAIIFDDGEKFGLWPKTHEWVYEKGWLRDFLAAVEADDTIETACYGEFLDAHRSKGIAYLPNVSYAEMGEWSLNLESAHAVHTAAQQIGGVIEAEKTETVLGGGIWKNFFVKYRESNHIHKRVGMLSKLRYALSSAEYDDLVFRAQTNDVLWHGVFGGLYLPNLRDNAYRYIIEAQAYAGRQLGHGAVCEDFDGDGFDEVLLHNPHQIIVVSTRHGGQLCEWDLVDKGFNLQNTLKRRREAYHDAMLAPAQHASKDDEGIDTIHTMGIELGQKERDALVFDWHERGSFIDHFSESRFDLFHFYHASYCEMGDFANQPYDIAAYSDTSVTLHRQGGIYAGGKSDTSVTKRLELLHNGIGFTIGIQTDYHRGLVYVCEWNLHFAEPAEVTFNGLKIGEGIVFEKLNSLVIRDPYLGREMVFALEREGDFYLHPISTVSQSEKGVDLTLQGIAIAFKIPLHENLVLNGMITLKESA